MFRIVIAIYKYMFAFVAGWKASLVSATVGGILLGLIEGTGVLFNSWQANQFRPQAPILPTELQNQAVVQ
jgi:import inner membrane translocase subunit TIM17